MRILDDKRDVSVDTVILYLTRSEACELRDSIASLLDGDGTGHEHTPSDDYTKEITVCLYDEETSLSHFDERSIRLIRENR